MAIATILPPARTVFVDSNGVPLVGGTVTFYIPNTTTLKTTWQDAGETIANSNPVILDGDGSALIYGSGQYEMVLNDVNGNLIWSGLTQDLYSLIFSNTGTVASGGYINKFRNADMVIAQRGASGTVTSGNSNYTLDGWIVGASGATVGWSQSGPFAGQLVLANYLLLSGNTSMTDTFLRQRIEGSVAASLSSQLVTIQGQISNNTTAVIIPTLTVRHASSTDNWGSSVVDVNAVPLQSCAIGVVTLVAYTFLADAASFQGLEVTIDFGSALNSNAKEIKTSGWDIRSIASGAVGLTSSPPPIEVRPIGPELNFCQRYYEIGAYVSWAGDGGGTLKVTIFYKAVKRAAATVTNSRSLTVGLTDGITSWYQNSNDSATNVNTWTASAEL